MTEKTMSEGRLEEIRAAAGYEFNPGTIALSAAWELIHEVDRLRSVAARQERMEADRLKAVSQIDWCIGFASTAPNEPWVRYLVAGLERARAALTPEARQ